MVENVIKSIKVKGADGFLRFVDSFVEGLRVEMNLSESLTGDMVLAISEALNNAFIHGHSRDENLDIELMVFVNDEGLNVVVYDQGIGHDVNMLRDDLQEELLDLPGGRGLFIMKALCKSVRYNDTGNQVTMVFDV
jgi:serine/threonine-protein kinase RsbW